MTAATTTASPRPTARERWRQWRWPVTVMVIVTIAVALVAWLNPSNSYHPLGSDNPRPNGAQALARILEQQGVNILPTRDSVQVGRADPGTTVLVAGHPRLSDQAIQNLAQTDATVVLLEPSRQMLRAFGLEVTPDAGAYTLGNLDVDESCAHPAALAAESIYVTGDGFRSTAEDDSAIQLCFTKDNGTSFMAVGGGGRVVALATGQPLHNEYLAREGNAALALHLLGQHDLLLWYTPSTADLMGEETASATMFDMLPSGSRAVGWGLIAVVVFLIFWRARRFGPIMVEPLPVSVPAAETLRGRGRLYRQSQDLAHAATSLKAGTVLSCAPRLGVSTHATRQETVAAISRASGWDSATVDHVLYGPHPTNEQELINLSQTLATLEREVHENVH